eukprot:m.111086 g.111086  ORF g.111086 m.111086 type:complete len:70 (-) comp15284_c0_seq1:143-352(-)
MKNSQCVVLSPSGVALWFAPVSCDVLFLCTLCALPYLFFWLRCISDNLHFCSLRLNNIKFTIIDYTIIL